jgi:hypothetical protein
MTEKWPSLPADGSQGVEHQRPDGTDCNYLAIIACNKCGWADPDPVRVAAAAKQFARIVSPDPVCECGDRQAAHLVRDRGRGRGACTHIDAARTCHCQEFTLAVAGDPR